MLLRKDCSSLLPVIDPSTWSTPFRLLLQGYYFWIGTRVLTKGGAEGLRHLPDICDYSSKGFRKCSAKLTIASVQVYVREYVYAYVLVCVWIIVASYSLVYTL